jgi:hypothetical protein
MSCCGGKRARVAVSSVPRGPRVVDESLEPAAPERKPRMFQYVGESSLTVRGAVSGRVYRFSRPGHQIEVAYDDAFAMMAERGVKAVNRS